MVKLLSVKNDFKSTLVSGDFESQEIRNNKFNNNQLSSPQSDN